MGKALYRKYRSRNLSEIVGQEHITTAVGNALKSGKISHAYLFTGPRGTGKTSVARILAHEINGLPYDETATHLDIIEIDAASNRRIDEIRELRERVHNAPASAKYKVYIIDEVHMLTREAFNALLKTLEEPPEHAVFILATTEAHKLPETIISRTQRFAFKPVELEKVAGHLRHIAKQEKIDASDEALQLIAEHGEGSFRDSISLLDQIRHTAVKIELKDVQKALGIAPRDAILQLVRAVEHGDTKTAIEELRAMHLQGYHAASIAKQLADLLRGQLIDGSNTLAAEKLSAVLRELLNVPAAQDGAKLLEIILLETAVGAGEPAKVEQPAVEATETQKPKASESSEKPAQPPKTAGKPPKPAAEPVQPEKEPVALTKGQLDEKSWQLVLQAIKARHNTLYSVARMAVPTFSGAELTLAFSFPFHQKRLNDAKNRQVIQDVIKQTTGANVTITCIVDANARTAPAAVTAPASDPNLETITNIFGGAEVVD